MLFFGFGALLVVVGLVELAGPPIWRGRLSGKRSRAATVADNTLEPDKPGAGFTLAASWPGQPKWASATACLSDPALRLTHRGALRANLLFKPLVPSTLLQHPDTRPPAAPT